MQGRNPFCIGQWAVMRYITGHWILNVGFESHLRTLLFETNLSLEVIMHDPIGFTHATLLSSPDTICI